MSDMAEIMAEAVKAVAKGLLVEGPLQAATKLVPMGCAEGAHALFAGSAYMPYGATEAPIEEPKMSFEQLDMEVKNLPQVGIDRDKGLGLGVVMCVLLFCCGANAQSSDPNGAIRKRAQRDAVVKSLGEQSRGFVEAYGEDSVVAVQACSVSGGRKLAEFYDKGGFTRLPSPRLLLRAIGHTYHEGDSVVDFVVKHSDDLLDPERMQVFCADPLTFALHVKPLDVGTVDYRNAQKQQQADLEKAQEAERIKFIAAGGGVLIVLFMFWRITRQKSY